jgi:flagellar operon protein
VKIEGNQAMKVHELQRQFNIQPVKPKPVEPSQVSRNDSARATETAKPFGEVLNQNIHDSQSLKFSAHALRRLDTRNVEMTPQELTRLQEGVKKAEEKGGRSSLILVDDNAFIVSINNKTVVTALPKEASLGNVFTNIDSVAIV